MITIIMIIDTSVLTSLFHVFKLFCLDLLFISSCVIAIFCYRGFPRVRMKRLPQAPTMTPV